jgi:hypothetical protein
MYASAEDVRSNEYQPAGAFKVTPDQSKDRCGSSIHSCGPIDVASSQTRSKLCDHASPLHSTSATSQSIVPTAVRGKVAR